MSKVYCKNCVHWETKMWAACGYIISSQTKYAVDTPEEHIKEEVIITYARSFEHNRKNECQYYQEKQSIMKRIKKWFQKFGRTL